MIPGNTSPATIHRILERLSRDHEFRELMLGDPVKAMLEYDIEIDATKIPQVRKLPGMETCAQISAKKPDDALAQAGVIWFCR